MKHYMYVRAVDGSDFRINLPADLTPESVRKFFETTPNSAELLITDRDGELWVIGRDRFTLIQVLADRSDDTAALR